MILADGTFLDVTGQTGTPGAVVPITALPVTPRAPVSVLPHVLGGSGDTSVPIAAPTGPATDTTPTIIAGARIAAPTASTPGIIWAPGSGPGPTIQQTTDTAAASPPFDTNTPAVTQLVPSAPDNSGAIAALGSLFQSAFASGSPQAPIISGGGGASLPTSDTSTSGTTDPTATDATPSSGPGLTTWAFLILAALGVFFAYKQYKKMQAKEKK